MPDYTQLLAALPTLPKSQRDAVIAALGKREFRLCADDPVYWLDASKHIPTSRWPLGMPYVFTKDPHKIYGCHECGGEVIENGRVAHLEILHSAKPPITMTALREAFDLLPALRPFPMMDYMAPIAYAWHDAQYFAIEKSRDMMATWLMIALFTWDAMFHDGRQHIFQSEDAFKTLELVQRSEIIYANTPEFLRKVIGPAKFSKGGTKSGEFYLLGMHSEILGFPQGEDQIRQFHPTGVFSDEAAFQIQAGATFAAIKPAIMGGGRYSAISSANPSWFMNVCQDTTDN